ncbi:replication initiator protein [Apis mellifera associated microvirus 29]|nr:replication initiator protein [Apis mellifera associated microvirus 29]
MCLNPINAELQEFGRPRFTPDGGLRLPCGKCYECIKKRSSEWALRARHEIACHDENCFITLTYSDEKLPGIFLVKDEFQKFMKRLRKHAKKPLRYMVSHEYGSNTFRPHHHAIIFGFNFPNQSFLKTTGKGEKIFTSPLLDSLWGNGHSSIGTANERTAYYIANYSLKGKRHELTDPSTGELVTVTDSMDASKRPAIGYNYLEQNYKQLVHSDEILPRFYIKKLEKIAPDLLEEYENSRSLKLKNRSSHEVYAKYIIDQQKLQNSETVLRTAPEIGKEDTHYKNYLKTNRDEYHRQTKDKK